MTPNEKAQQALQLLKESIYETIKQHPNGIGNSEISRLLGIESDFEGNQKNYLSWSVLGLLVNEKKVSYRKIGNRKYYFINEGS